MIDYYQILGVDENASGEEIEARWAELKEQYRAHVFQREGRAAERIMEIHEAYDVLSDPSTRKEYDLQRSLKRSFLKKRDQLRKERYARRKRVIIPVAIVVLFLIGGFFVFKVAQLTIQYERIAPTSAPVPDKKRPISISKSVPSEIPKAPDQEASQTLPEKMPKSQERTSSVANLSKKELEPKEKIAKETVETEKTIPGEMPKPEVPKSPKSTSEVRPKVGEPKPFSTARRPATDYVQPSEGTQKPKVGVVKEKEKPKATPKEVRKGAPKEMPKETPKEVGRTLPKEEVKTIPKKSPLPKTSRPQEAKPVDQASQVAEMPSPKPAAPVAAIPAIPPPFVKESEVRQFLAKYVDRYTQRDLDGFLSLFSSMAIRNQKDGIKEIRKIYSRQFKRYERFKYQLKNPRIEILEKSVKVRASYEIEEFSKKGETKQLRGDIEWDLVKEEGELKILAIQYRYDKTR